MADPDYAIATKMVDDLGEEVTRLKTKIDRLEDAIGTAMASIRANDHAQAHRVLYDALHVTAAPRPYVCTIVIEMPADDGDAIVPSDLVEWLTDHGGQLVEWHDEDMIGAVERSET